jgi:hypothetical protein
MIRVAMTSDIGTDALERGATALREREWTEAREAFEDAAGVADTPEAHDGLGLALWWLRDVDAAIAHREQAYAAFRARGDLTAALRIALWLATEYLEASATAGERGGCAGEPRVRAPPARTPDGSR